MVRKVMEFPVKDLLRRRTAKRLVASSTIASISIRATVPRSKATPRGLLLTLTAPVFTNGG